MFSHIKRPRHVLVPRRTRLVDPNPRLLPGHAEVHGDAEALAAVVDLADLTDVEVEAEFKLVRTVALAWTTGKKGKI